MKASFQSIKITGHFSELIESCWRFESGRDWIGTPHRLLPILASELIICSKGHYFKVDNSGKKISVNNVHLTSSWDSALDVILSESMVVYGVRFQPWVSHNSLTGPFGDSFFEIAEKFRAQEDLSKSHFGRLVKEFDNSVSGRFNFKTDEILKSAILRLNQNPALSIRNESSELGISQKTLERKFIKNLGLTPKEYARRKRATSAALNLFSGENVSNVVSKFGYYDASHLHKDLNSIANCPPSKVVENFGELNKLVHKKNEFPIKS